MEMLDELKKDFDEAINCVDCTGYDPMAKSFLKALYIGLMILILKSNEDDVSEELEGAKKYMKAYMEKDDEAYKEIALDELKHAGILIKKQYATADEKIKALLEKQEIERQELMKRLNSE